MSATPAWRVGPGRPAGTHRVPGDKSISHRALILGALTPGTSRIHGLLEGADCLATAAVLRAVGVPVTRGAAGEWAVEGRPASAWQAPETALDCGNSGTTARLLMGPLTVARGTSTLVGDASLMRRPMARVAAPLRHMGARVSLGAGETLPARIAGETTLSAYAGDIPVASAQVKSALLLAGIAAGVGVRLGGAGATRDHTERLLRAAGVPVTHSGGLLRLAPGARPAPLTTRVPGDLSSAAFLFGAAALVPGAEVTVEGVGLNPTRSGVLDLLVRFGARVESEVTDLENGEPVGRVRVTGAALHGIRIGADEVVRAIDELPLLLALAGAAKGETTVVGAAELRVKESDRLATVAAGLRALGRPVEEQPDGLRVTGGPLAGGEVDARGDHRIAMAFAVLGGVASGPVRVRGTEGVPTSFPGFLDLAARVGLAIVAEAA